MPTITKADDKVSELVARLVVADFPELEEAGVTIDVFEARAARKDDGEPRGPALKLHGYPCKAIAEIHSHKRRVGGETDCRITVDGDALGDWSDLELEAILFHEIHHFIVCKTKPKFKKVKGKLVETDPGGQVILDDSFRPKLKMRLHDVELGIFAKAAERYGWDSADVKAVQVLIGRDGNLLFPWAPDAIEDLEPRLAMAGAGR